MIRPPALARSDRTPGAHPVLSTRPKFSTAHEYNPVFAVEIDELPLDKLHTR
jgi:hypothetical protein